MTTEPNYVYVCMCVYACLCVFMCVYVCVYEWLCVYVCNIGRRPTDHMHKCYGTALYTHTYTNKCTNKHFYDTSTHLTVRVSFNKMPHTHTTTDQNQSKKFASVFFVGLVWVVSLLSSVTSPLASCQPLGHDDVHDDVVTSCSHLRKIVCPTFSFGPVLVRNVRQQHEPRRLVGGCGGVSYHVGGSLSSSSLQNNTHTITHCIHTLTHTYPHNHTHAPYSFLFVRLDVVLNVRIHCAYTQHTLMRLRWRIEIPNAKRITQLRICQKFHHSFGSSYTLKIRRIWKFIIHKYFISSNLLLY